jgi:hypothetical protein
MLVIQSGFIPRFLGYGLIVAGIGDLAAAFTAFVVPQLEHSVGQVAMILELGELPIIFWLAIWGARERTA